MGTSRQGAQVRRARKSPAPPSAAEIARGLSDYERDAVAALCDGEPVRFACTSHHARLRRLLRLGLWTRPCEMAWEVTDLGRAVHAEVVGTAEVARGRV